MTRIRLIKIILLILKRKIFSWIRPWKRRHRRSSMKTLMKQRSSIK